MKIIQAIVLLRVCIALSYANPAYTELTVALNKMVDTRVASLEIINETTWAPLLTECIPDKARTTIVEFIDKFEVEDIEHLTSDQIVPVLTAVLDAYYYLSAFDDYLQLMPTVARPEAWRNLIENISKPGTVKRAEIVVASHLQNFNAPTSRNHQVQSICRYLEAIRDGIVQKLRELSR